MSETLAALCEIQKVNDPRAYVSPAPRYVLEGIGCGCCGWGGSLTLESNPEQHNISCDDYIKTLEEAIETVKKIKEDMIQNGVYHKEDCSE